MKAAFNKFAVSLTLVFAMGWPTTLVGDDSSRSVQDGVYSRAQASRGRKLYAQLCRTCHEDRDFAGSYMQAWNGKTAYDLYYLLESTMPEEAPGVEEPEVYTDIVAYMFSLSEFPRGEAEMASDDASLKKILIEGPYGGSDD